MATKAQNTTFGFRIVVRGTNSKNKRVRRVLTVQARSYDEVDVGGSITKAKLDSGLDNVRFNVLPPLV